MIMVGAQLAEVGGEKNGDVQWIAEVAARNLCGRKELGESVERTTTTERENEIPHEINAGLKVVEETKIPNHRLVIPNVSPFFRN
jgi:hypothetical protein